MTRNLVAILSLTALSAWAVWACDDARKRECDQLLGAMKPLDNGNPSAETVDAVAKQVEGLKFENQPLRVYAKNYRQTLSVLSGTLKLKATGTPPDGTDNVINENLKEARTDRDDVQRLCSN